MAFTNFAALQPQAKVVWARQVWKDARDMAFMSKFMGTNSNSMIQRITELTKTEKGEQAIIQLLADLIDDGVIGDNEREGNEEEMLSYSQIITIDLITHGVRNKGKLADQKAVIRFRDHARDRLSYWLANRMDQLGLLTLSGIGYGFTNNSAVRTSSAFSNLSFASDVTAPTAARHRNWDGTALIAGNTATVTTAFLPNYKMIVDLTAYAKDHYVRPLISGGKEFYILFVKPGTLAVLKKDADYQRAITTALPRNASNPWFTGATVTIDGVVIHEHRLVYSTTGAAGGAKWGSGSTVEGTRSLLCGAQAMGMIDLGPPEWNEKTFQYGSQQGINVDKIFGLLKPKFESIYETAGTPEDFGVVAVDHHLP